MTDVHVLGIRHHGPGSARAVAASLAELAPDLVLIEGAPELDGVAALASRREMLPPVAGLVYAPDRPRLASFYPLAVFSPEWVALRWAAAAGVPARFMDLPAAHHLALVDEGAAEAGGPDEEATTPAPPAVRTDPIAVLAAAAGYDDAERWWEDAMEHRRHQGEVFPSLMDAMTTLRDNEARHDDEVNARREAAMRRRIRAELKQGRDRVVVVCGAWHAPALVPERFPTATSDNALLKGLPKVKVAATWVPWTSARLAYASGYGAGVPSPGWYHHLYTEPEDTTTKWMVKVAHLLREERLDASSAAVIEAVRLADALAAVRGRPLPGLSELTDATRAAMCGGSDLPLQLVADRLLVGEALGEVPDDTPMVPLAQDLAAQQKRLRLKPSAAQHQIDLDLRKPIHLARSQLFHRLQALGIRWAQQLDPGRTRGTFREAWQLEWAPELAVAVIESAGFGNTIEAAATNKLVEEAASASDLSVLTTLVERCLLAELPEALPAVMGTLADRTARQHDVAGLIGAVEPLARIRRYGNVRQADTEAVHHVLTGIVTRVAIGLPGAAANLDDDAASELRAGIESVQRGLATLGDSELHAVWEEALEKLADHRAAPGTIVGRAVRLLLDARRLDPAHANRRLSLALSRAASAIDGAGWLDGFLAGDAVLLLHDHDLLSVVDGWVGEIGDEHFEDVLPLIRRTFGRFAAAERRMIGEHLRRGIGSGTDRPDGDGTIDPERAARVGPVLELILGHPVGRSTP